MKLHPAQKTIVKSPHRFRVLRAGRRFGKTILAVEEMLFHAVDKDNAHIVYIAPTFQSARDIAWEILKKRVSEIKTLINETRLDIEVPNKYGGISKISLRSWDNVETLRGQAFNFIVLDEVAHIKSFWVNWNEVLRPSLTDRIGKALFISTPSGFNHFYDLCNQELLDKDFKSFHFTSWDNPHLSKEELEKAKATLPPESFAQEYEASFQKTQGLVYKEFSRDKHLVDSFPPSYGEWKKVGGIDFGYRNPAGITHVYFDGEQFYVDEEWYKTGRTDADIADYAETCGFKEVYPDPENSGGVEELRRRRLNVKDVTKGKGSVLKGIQMVRDVLIRGKLKINRRCVNLIAEFEMYSYDDDKTERNENEEPLRANNHLLDSLRYVVSHCLPFIRRREYLNNLPNIYQPPRRNPAI